MNSFPNHQNENSLMPAYRSQQLVGLARWRAECAGEIAPPPELRYLRGRYGWTSRQISLAFEALQSVPVHPAQPSYLIFDRELTSREAAMLTEERLIRLDRNGWALTRKGEELFSLLLAYGDPQYEWGRQAITF
jgi:hypothetical protein